MDQLPGPTQKRKHLDLFNAVLRYRTSNAQYTSLYIHQAPYVPGIQTVTPREGVIIDHDVIGIWPLVRFY